MTIKILKKEVSKRYNFTKNAIFPRDMNFDLYWNSYVNILSDLL